MSSILRPARVAEKNSAQFWKEFNRACSEVALPEVVVGRRGLPTNPAEAYQNLFTYRGAQALFRLQQSVRQRPTFLNRILQQRLAAQRDTPLEEPEDTGANFVKGFLRYILDPGSEHGYGSTGRSELNSAHIYLAALLEAQQSSNGWDTRAFCRTILTTNFDTLLQNSLQMVNLLYTLTDRPEKGFDPSAFHEEEAAIHLVYTHGSILRHNPASTIDELDNLAERNVSALRRLLACRDVIVIGYGGWNDGLMAALQQCGPSGHEMYWCDLHPEPVPHVAEFLSQRPSGAAYVCLGEGGADGVMRTLYHTLVPPDARRDPIQWYRDWYKLVRNRRQTSGKSAACDAAFVGTSQ